MDKNRNKALINIAVSILLVAVLLAGTYLRTMNTNWDEGRHLHPDERFLSQVISVISPVDSVEAYFDTARSSLNPANRDFGFFVYGTLPVFIIRYVGEWTGQTGYDLNTLVGRQLSAGFDVLTILLVFLIGLILYNKWVGLVGATLYAFAVLPIQQAHFMTVDSFTNTFGMLTVLAAVLLLKRKRRNLDKVIADNDEAPENRANIKSSGQVKEILLFLFFGIALGMATASKINAVSLALLLPLVELVRYLQTPVEERAKSQWRSIVMIALAGAISFLVFRTFQPYAFDGPVFFGMKINQGWWGSMQSLRGQATGEVDFPPALQWTRRELTFSVKNLVLWGVGIPFAVTAFLGALTMLYKIIKRKEMIHLPVLAWTAVYFAWQGFAWVKAMRYLLLIYPLLAIFAGWLIYTLIAKPEAIK
ncbi:MAG TPA: phospholipid carrier-dependent glycosyltransferase, partial [Anaerolineaceae bacterium]|nr:phospholipid carrier-dependent glycosyltransferase [Anaerolineaceae bacterium]